MNTEFDPLQELEWLAQERARTDVHPDSRNAEYRLIARALRQPMPDQLPSDFARQLAARVGHVPLDTRLERWLMRFLIGAMVVSGLVAVLLYGADWWQAIVACVPQISAMTVNWVCAVGACMAGSWLFERLREMANHGRDAHA